MGVAVGLGIFEFPFSNATAFWRWVDLCEAGGVDSIWQSDRISGRQPVLECMSLMAALAGGTRRLKFGMFVASVGLRDPLLLAKQCATIDVLSDGRMLPAFGVGNPRSDDWRATATETKGAGRRADEALDIIAALWRGELVNFDGEFHQYREASISPLPVQKRFPPLDRWSQQGRHTSHRAYRHRLGRRDGTAESNRRGGTGNKGGARGDRPQHRPRSLWGRLQLPIRQRR